MIPTVKGRDLAVWGGLLACLCLFGCGFLRTQAVPEPDSAPAMLENAASAQAPADALEPGLEAQAANEVERFAETPIAYDVGLFCWNRDCIDGELRAKLYMLIKRLGVTELYQSFSTEDVENGASGNASGEETRIREPAHDFLHDLRLMGVDCYYLTGGRALGLDPEGTELIARIRSVAAYNAARPDAPFAGVCLDVEAYLTDEWESQPDAVMQSAVLAHTRAYAAAKEAGLRVIVCLPVWYDASGRAEALTQLMQNACDEAALMNYNRNREQEQIAFEVDCARELDKPVTCIFEFQPVGAHGLKENETYYHIGIERAVENFEALYRAFGYPKLKFAYHELSPLLELLDA